MNILKKVGLWRGLTFIFAVFLVVSISVSQILESQKNEIDAFLGTQSSVVVSSDDGTLWSAYVPDQEYLNEDGTGNSQAIVDAHISVGKNLSAEGSVLLKNNGKTLPLAKNTKITLLGIRSNIILAGSGMGVSVPAEQTVQLKDALSNSFTVNATMDSIYTELNKTIKLTNNDRAAASGYDPKEPSLSNIAGVNANYKNSFSDHETAIVVVGRPNSEMGDYTPGAAGVAAGTGANTAMALTTNEKDAINLATENFDKVIVLVNTNSAMEIDDLKTNEKIDAILWIGHPGNYGTLGICDILDGTTVPSGHLYDIYSSDSLSSPAMMNMGKFSYTNKSEITRTPSNGAGQTDYLIEAEGVYVGYRYYETRYDDVVWGRGNANSNVGSYKNTSGWSYAKEVSYGFGYGLSYSNFNQKIDSVKMKQGPHSLEAEITVTVENTGDYDAKDVIQIYGQAPYKKGGVEKPSVQLLNFDKTKVLAKKGGKTTMVVTADLQNIASWDSSAANGKGTYILDEGDYYFAIGNGAHDALNNILAAQGKTTTNGMDYNGVAAKAHKWSYDYPAGNVDDQTFAVSKAGTKVTNALETADWNYWEKGKVKHLSRSSWDTTYPETYSTMTATADMIKQINGNVYQIKTDDDVSGITFNKEGTMKFAEMKGASYDDRRWEELLNQLDLLEALQSILNGNRTYTAMDSIGFLAGRYTENGPNGIGGRGFSSLSYNNFGDTTPPWYIPETDKNAGFKLNTFPSAPVVASTFNPVLAAEEGRIIGNDALFVGLPIIWGPGMNTHRHPYNGRNGEYYSEDPIITGVMGMEFAVAALEKGLIAAPKHYAFNDQEVNRYSVAPFMKEQRAREIELRAFQIAFEASKYDTDEKNIGMLGVMTSFSKIGPYEVNASKGMLFDILRTEWGYKGYIVSDMNDDTDIYTDCIVAGLTSYDTTGDVTKLTVPITAEKYKGDATILKAVKQAIKYNLYVIAQSNYMNTINTNSHTEWRMTWWRALYISMIAVSGTIMLAGASLYCLSELKFSKKERD